MEAKVRTAKVSQVINGWRVDFYTSDKKRGNWFTPIMEEADEVAENWQAHGTLPGTAANPKPEVTQ
jgi:hypothetical protein